MSQQVPKSQGRFNRIVDPKSDCIFRVLAPSTATTSAAAAHLKVTRPAR